jgi:hypothetical protein
MAAVIHFSNKQRLTKSAEPFFGPAQVIIFSGVRFERLVDSPAITKFKPPRVTRLPRHSNQATAEELD